MIAHPIRSLLDLDPDLGALLSGERLASARRELAVRVAELPAGEWDAGGELAAAHPANLGLLVVQGMIAREVLLRETVSSELLGPGDIVRPWRFDPEPDMLETSVRWNVLSPARAAVLDRRLAAALAAYPEINAAIVDRFDARARRLAVTQAISQLTGVEARLESLFWHLADRWGRVAVDGVIVPLALSHRRLGALIGARRPTVSSAIARLADERRLERRADGTWLLPRAGAQAPARVSTPQLVPQRGPLLPQGLGRAAA